MCGGLVAGLQNGSDGASILVSTPSGSPHLQILCQGECAWPMAWGRSLPVWVMTDCAWFKTQEHSLTLLFPLSCLAVDSPGPAEEAHKARSSNLEPAAKADPRPINNHMSESGCSPRARVRL